MVVTQTDYTDKNINGDSQYYYRLRALNSNSTSAYSNQGYVESMTHQTIDFTMVESKTLGDDPFELIATATSGLPVTFTTSDSTILSVNGNIASIKGIGKAVITAHQDGNMFYWQATPVSITAEILPPLIFPNPAREAFSIEVTDDFKDAESKIISAEGEMVQQNAAVLKQGKLTFDIRALTAGVYMVQVRNKNNNILFKIIKQ